MARGRYRISDMGGSRYLLKVTVLKGRAFGCMGAMFFSLFVKFGSPSKVVSREVGVGV